MTEWVLIVLLFVNGHFSVISLDEFDSKDSCVELSDKIFIPSVREYYGILLYECVEKKKETEL